ncbi:hypothetical protein BH09SUM1_BH09SUM1_25780 [soil metagenome]
MGANSEREIGLPATLFQNHPNNGYDNLKIALAPQ